MADAATGLKVGVLGINHRHIYGMLEGMQEAGAVCKGWWTGQATELEQGFVKRFGELPRLASRDELLADQDIELVLIAAVPDERADLAIAAMEAGKDVMVDKPGCTTLDQLARLRETVAATGRIWSVDFSERFEVRASLKAKQLVDQGAIGKVVQTIGLGPHRLNRATRPAWFFQRERTGGILCDIASHQIDQFLHYTGATDAQLVACSTGNYGNSADPGLEDFGEIMLRSETARGYIRVDWFTPDALPTWGDGRLVLLGTDGYIELRKYVDVCGQPGTDHVFVVNNDECRRVDCADVTLDYFARLAVDVAGRTQTAMPQAHAFKVMELAINAQRMAEQNDGG